MQGITKKKTSKGLWHSTLFSLFALMSIIMLSFAFPALAGAVSVTVGSLITNNDTPTLTGTVSTDAINVNIRIGTETENHNAAISGTNWSLNWPTELAEGTYDVHAAANDADYNFGHDSTTDELVIDTTAPVITLAGAEPQYIEVGSDYTELGATANDNYDGDITGSIVTDSSAVTTGVLGDYTVTYDITDTAGNAAIQATRTVSVVDTTLPVITVLGDDPQIIEVGSAYTELGATANDNYDGDITGSIVTDSSAVTTGVVADYTVTYDVTDSEGNAAIQATRTVSVVDTTLPVITVLGDDPQIIEVGSAYTELGATANDNYDGDITGSIVTDSSAVTTGVVADYTVTYDVTDSEGNAAIQATRTVSVVDTTLPVITVLGDDPQIIEVGSAYTELGATANDNYDGDITGSIVTDSSAVTTGVLGDYTVTYDVTDSEGNAAIQATRTVSVVDTTLPVITVLGNDPQIIEVGSAYTELGATANDNYDGDITGSIVTDSSAVTTGVLGDYTVTYDVTDSEGNAAIQATRTVSVVDTTLPVITVLGDDPQIIEVGSAYTELGATANDNYDGDITGSIVTDSSAVTTGVVADYTVTYDVTDSEGNAAIQATRTVSVVDTTLPVITVLGNDPQIIEVGSAYTELGATANDNYDGDITGSIVTDSSAVTTGVLGDYTVTYDVTDSEGNAAIQATRTVSVVDTTLPVITVLGNDPQILHLNDTYTELGATALDNYDGNITALIVPDSSAVNTAVLGDYTVTYDVTDAAGNEAIQATRTVSVINQVPTANDDSYTIFENDSIQNGDVTTAGTADFLGDEPALITLVDQSNVTHGTLTWHFEDDGTFDYDPYPLSSGQVIDTFTYQIEDANGDTDIATVTITITDVPLFPNPIPDIFTMNEDDYLGEEDGDLGALIGDVKLARTPYNTPDELGDLPAQLLLDTDPETPGAQEPEDNDPDASGLQTTLSNGTLDWNVDGTFAYTPNANFYTESDPEQFYYLIVDANGDTSSSVAVQIYVDPVDDVPIAVNDTFEMDEDSGSLAGDVGANDYQHDAPVIFTRVSDVTKGNLVLNGHDPVEDTFDGTFSYTPDQHENGADSFTYTITDKDGQTTAPATVTINISPTNDAPVAQDDNITNIDEDSLNNELDILTNNGNGPDSDLDGDDLTIRAVGGSDGRSDHGAVSIREDGKRVIYTPDVDYYGPDSFGYQICDIGQDGIAGTSDDLCDTATVTLTINNVNDAPTAVAGEGYEMDEDSILSINSPGVLGDDYDLKDPDDTLVAELVSPPSNAIDFNLNSNGSFGYWPEADFYGTVSFTYYAVDNGTPPRSSETVTVYITVEPINDPPETNNYTFSVFENAANGAEVGTVVTTDAENDTLAYSITSGNINGAFTINNTNGAITVADAAQLDTETTPQYTLEVTVSETSTPELYSATSYVTINVTDVNEPPVAGNESVTMLQDTTIDINVLLNVTDPDDNIDPDSVEIISDVQHGNTSVLNGVVTYTPAEGYLGDDSFDYKVCDTDVLCDTATVSITVSPDNIGPSFSSVPNTNASVGIDYYYRVFIDDPDVDDTLTIIAVSLPDWLTFNSGNGRQAYVYGTPTSADIGDHYVELEVRDSFEETATQSFTITVSDVGLLSHINWTVTCDSQETIGEDGACINAIDGVNSIYWVTEWWDGSPDHPHYIEIDLGDAYNLTECWYLPRQYSQNGRIAEYELYVSLDGTDWDTLDPVAAGIFPNTTALQKVPLASTTGRFIQLVSLSNVTGAEWAAVAELDFIGSLFVANETNETNEAPDGMITDPATSQTIMVDDSVDFAGTASDPDGDLMDCVWNFGDPTIPDATGFSPGAIIFPSPGTYIVTMTVTDGLGVADPSPDTRAILVESDSNWFETSFDKTDWTATCDSQETIGEDGACINAIDGDSSTYWVTEWTGGSPVPPHELKVDFGAVYDIEGFRYSPRLYQWEGHENGRIKDYNFYVSLDGVNWVLVKSGTFANTDTPQEIIFSKARGQHVKLEAITEINDNPWTCVAELDILAEFVGASNPAPDAVIDIPNDQQITIYPGDSIYFAGTGSDIDGEAIVAYQWDFKDPYMVFDPQNDPRTLAVPGSIQFNTPGSFTVTFTVQDESGLWDSTPDTRVVKVISDSTWLGHTGWSLWMVDSEETTGEDGAATNAFDETTTSYWVTQWTGESTPPPHEIQIDLGSIYRLEGFRCVPRQDGSTNGNIKDYDFYISSDGSTWGTAVATGTFDSTSTAKEVLFNGVEGQYIRLVAISEVNGNPWTCVSDMDVFGEFVGDGNMPPVATIGQPVGETTILVRSSVSFQGSGTDPDDGDFINGYLWSFSGPAAIADSTLQNPDVTFNVPGDYTVSFTVYDSAGLPDPTPDTRVVHVESNFSPISQAGWSLVYVDSEETVGEDGRAIRAFDGNSDTYWVTQWTGGSPVHPHEIVIDLGTFYDVDGLSYLPRQDFNSHDEPLTNGNVLDYEVYLSFDGDVWGTFVASGTFDTTRLAKEVNFTSQRARFIRFVALSEINGNPWTNAAEINVSGVLSTSSMVLTPETAIVLTGGSVSFTVTDGEPDYEFTIIDNQSGGTIDQSGNYTAGATGNVVDTIRVTDALFSVKEAVVTVHEDIKIWPQTKNVAVNGKVDFYATGGVPGYTFTIIEDQSEGSTIDSATGLYQAGPVSGGTDSIQVTDSSGNTDVATVSVLDMSVVISPTGISLPVGGQIYFTASGGAPDYSFSIATNLSGGTIDHVTGLYQAGTTFGVNDIIQVVDSQGDDSQTFVSVIEATQYLGKENWAIHYVSSEEVNGEYAPAEYAIDDDVDTYWVTKWQDGVAQHPHEIQINLGDIYELDGFQYIHNVASGQIEFYEFHVSLDGINWGDPVVESCFGYNIDQENVFFPRIVGQYVKLVTFSSVNNADWISITEINLMGSPFLNNYAPQTSIDQPLDNTELTAGESVIFAGTGTMVDGPAPLTFHWDFGDPDIADSLLEVPGEVFYNNPGTYTVTFSVSDGLDLTSQDTRVVKVLDQSAEVLVPQERISVLYVDSEELTGENTPAGNVLDGNSATNWVTEWSIDPNPTTPHLFILDLGGAYLIDGFRYLPRQDWYRGRVADYHFYVSIDGKNWGSAVATGTFPDVAAEQQILFTPKWGRYVRFVALSEVNGNPWTVIAEFNVEGKCDSPYIKIVDPLAGEIEQITDFTVSAGVCLNSSSHTAWGVKFIVDGNQEQTIVLPVNGVIQPDTFKATFTGITPGLHSVEAFIIDADGRDRTDASTDVPYENTYDVINNIIVGESYVAIGDSLTVGLHDDVPDDDVSADGRNSGGGFEPVLNDLLTDELAGTPHTVVNEGFSGEKTEEGLRRLPKVLLENSQSGYFLILYGANDRLNDLPSGLGTDPDAEGYPHNYKSYLQQIVTKITSAGKKAYLAKNLHRHDASEHNIGYVEYNKVIDELITELNNDADPDNNINEDYEGNSIISPPFYEYFKQHPEQQSDGIHPKGVGYQAMADLWRNAIMGYNNDPVAVDDLSEIVNQDTVDNILYVLANDYDYDLDTLTITVVSDPANGAATIDNNGTPLDPTDDVILYTPDSGFTGLDSFTYTISDGQGGEATAIVEVIVNTPPTAGDDVYATIDQDSVDNILTVLSNDSDDDDDPLTITAVSDPTNGTATIDDNGTPSDPTDDIILYTPSPGYIGDDSFTYDISDGNGGTATGTVTITVILIS